MTIRKHAEQKFSVFFCAILLVFIVGDGASDVPLIDISVSISFVFFTQCSVQKFITLSASFHW